MLGRARYHAVIAERGGRELDEVPFSSLRYGRALDDMTSASAAVPATTTGTRVARRIGSVDAFEHELVIYRGEEVGWLGPLRQPTWTPSGVGLEAMDVFEWFERRKLPVDRTFTQVDLAEIFASLIDDAMAPDPSPGIVVQPRPTGILGDRAVLASANRMAADALRELARNGVDFTVIGRTVRCGGEEVGAASLGPLLNQHFVFSDSTPQVVGAGEYLATEATVTGATQPSRGASLSATAGGVDERLGLVQRVFNESAIADLDSLGHAALTRWEMLGRTPYFVTGVLRDSAPGLDALVPGAVADVDITVGAKRVERRMRLSKVNVTVTNSEAGMAETVRVELIPLGTTE